MKIKDIYETIKDRAVEQWIKVLSWLNDKFEKVDAKDLLNLKKYSVSVFVGGYVAATSAGFWWGVVTLVIYVALFALSVDTYMKEAK